MAAQKGGQGDLITLHFKFFESPKSLFELLVCHSAGGFVGPACLGPSVSQFVDYTAPAVVRAKACSELISLGTA